MMTNDTALAETTEKISIEQPVSPAKPAKTFAPISATKRIDAMDILRGFALIGIILMNIEWFNRPIAELMSFDYSLTGVDWGSNWLIKVFVEGKFYKLFSLLFGMGFAIMLFKAQEAGKPFGAWFVRRMLILFVFGMAHMIFLWGGDILHDYAFGGLMLLGWVLLVNTKRMQRFNHSKYFLRIGMTMALLPIVVALGAALFFGTTRDEAKINESWQQRQAVTSLYEELESKQALVLTTNELLAKEVESYVSESDEEEIDEDTLSPEALISHKAERRLKYRTERKHNIAKEVDAFTQESYWTATKYRAIQSLEALKDTPIFALIIGFPIFMMGYWLIASGAMREPEKHINLFKSMAWIGMGIGLFMNVTGVLINLHPATKSALEIRASGDTIFFLGQYILTAGYLGLLMLMILSPKTQKLLTWLAPMGRMALTNYISHSIILTSIFYGYAGGMFGEISRGPQILIVIAIILAQALLSRWWLNNFQFGPLEWLWRSLTYLKFQPMKVDKVKTISSPISTNLNASNSSSSNLSSSNLTNEQATS